MKFPRAFLLVALLVTGAPALASPPAAEQQLIDTEKAWNQAFIKRDASFLDKLYAEEYLFTDQDGKTYDRSVDIDGVKTGEFKMLSGKLDDLKVHVYGDFATVTGVNDFKGTFKGEDASCICRFTDVFVKRDGRWQVVASHVTRILAK